MTFDPLGQVPVGRRTARLAEKKRKQQRNRRLAAGVAALSVLVAGVSLWQARGDDGPGTTKQTRTQQTLLLQVKGADGTAVASALLAHDRASSEGSVVLVPPQVITTVPGFGSQAFGKALANAGPKGSRDALADLLGITIDGGWVLDEASFARLIDQAGGVQVTVDVPVQKGRVITLQPGAQKLGGSAALSFATYLAVGEQEQTRLTRLQAVLDGLVQVVSPTTETLVRSLGPGSQLSLKPKVAADVLLGLKQDDGKQQLQYRSLPVIKVDAGTDETRFRIDATGARNLVDELLAQSVPAGVRAEGNRVLVLNGVGTPGLGAQVRDKLVPAGFVFVGSRNAPEFGHAKTLVLVRDTTAAGQRLGVRVAKALGVPATSVQSSDQIGTIADVVVVVGADFRP